MARNWQRGVMRVMGIGNHPIEAIETIDCTPWYRRVRFHGPEFVQRLEPFPTIWARLWVPNPNRGPEWLSQRGYTLLEVDAEAGTFAIEFVLHETAGPAGDWAKQATAGQHLEIAITPARPKLPPTYDGVLLAGDTTALPAINSWLEHFPAQTPVDVLIEDGHDDREQLPIHPHPGARVQWVTPGPTRGAALAQAVADTGVAADGYAWFAGEKTLVTAVRQVVRERLAKERQFSQFYWIEGRNAG